MILILLISIFTYIYTYIYNIHVYIYMCIYTHRSYIYIYTQIWSICAHCACRSACSLLADCPCSSASAFSAGSQRTKQRTGWPAAQLDGFTWDHGDVHGNSWDFMGVIGLYEYIFIILPVWLYNVIYNLGFMGILQQGINMVVGDCLNPY